MNPESRIGLASVLLAHFSLMIPLGIALSCFCFPNGQSADGHYRLSFDCFQSDTSSDVELESCLKLLDLTKKEMFTCRETIENLISRKSITELEFLEDVEPKERAEFLGQRLSARQSDFGSSFCWTTTLQGVSKEDAEVVFAELHLVAQERLDEIAAPLSLPLSPQLVYLDYNENTTGFPHRISVGALLGAILVLIGWAIWTPPGQRKLALPVSVFVLTVGALLTSIAGATLDYGLMCFCNPEWESRITVRAIECPSDEFLDSLEENALVKELDQKLEHDRWAEPFFCKGLKKYFADSLISNRSPEDWAAFKDLRSGWQMFGGPKLSEDKEAFSKYICDRISIEADPEAESEIFHIGFRCGNERDVLNFLDYLYREYRDRIEMLDVADSQRSYEFARFNKTGTRVKANPVMPSITSPFVYDGAIMGAICCLMMVSASRVLYGLPPV